MSAKKPPFTLSKSRFMAGVQCLKRLMLEVHHPDLADDLDDAEIAVIEAGHQVGRLAHQLYPGGNLIQPDYDDREAEFVRTQNALQNPDVPAIFEAAFAYGADTARIDILERVDDDLWDIVEVKASARVKEEHILDTAFQLHVLRGAGAKVRSVRVLHPSRDYVRQGDIDARAFFSDQDITAEISPLVPRIAKESAHFHQVVASGQVPPVKPGSHCNKPVRCPFFTHCHRVQTLYPLDHLPNLSMKARSKIAERAIEEGREINDVRDLDPAFAESVLSERQQRIYHAIRTGEPYINVDGLEAGLARIVLPAAFIDFEAFQPPIPIYEGTRPFERIPFQWSNHILAENGRLYHKEYLHADDTDPRRRFITRLLASLKRVKSVVVYSSYERQTLDALAEQFPDLSAEIDDVKSRIVDLLPIVSHNVYYPQQQGSFSVKYLGPVLVPGFTYDDLTIRNGAMAAAAYAEIIDPNTSPARRVELSSALLRYCGRDTEILVKMYLALRREVERRRHPERFQEPTRHRKRRVVR